MRRASTHVDDHFAALAGSDLSEHLHDQSLRHVPGEVSDVPTDKRNTLHEPLQGGKFTRRFTRLWNNRDTSVHYGEMLER